MNSILESFYNNFIAEDRYRMILDGLQVVEGPPILKNCLQSTFKLMSLHFQ